MSSSCELADHRVYGCGLFLLSASLDPRFTHLQDDAGLAVIGHAQEICVPCRGSCKACVHAPVNEASWSWLAKSAHSEHCLALVERNKPGCREQDLYSLVCAYNLDLLIQVSWNRPQDMFVVFYLKQQATRGLRSCYMSLQALPGVTQAPSYPIPHLTLLYWVVLGTLSQ